MFRKTPKEPTALEEVIDAAIQQLDPNSKEYTKQLKHIATLMELKTKDRPQRVSPDVWVTVGGNLLAVLVIVGYERSHVVTSKGLMFLKSLR